MSFWMVLLLSSAGPSTLSSSPSPTASAPVPSLVVLDLKPAAASDAELAKLATSSLVEALGKQSAGKVNVLGLAEASALLELKAKQSLMGCDDEKCVADLSNAFKADQVVTGRVGVMAQRLVAFASVIDTKTATVVGRASVDVPLSSEGLREGMGKLAKQTQNEASSATDAVYVQKTTSTLAKALLDPEHAEGADARIGSLRIAMLVDETDETGAPSTLHPIETCLQRGMLDAGAELVSPSVLAALRKQTSAREVLAGRIPESVTSDDVDVIFAGAAQVRPAGEYMSAQKMEAQASVQLVKLDSGDVLASENLVGQGLEHNATAAARRSVEKLCERASGQIKAALDRKVAHGERVVVDVEGVPSTEAASALLHSLEKLHRVAKVHLKKWGKNKATYDVVMRSGDGNALALDMHEPLLLLDEVGGGHLKAQWHANEIAKPASTTP